MSAQESKMILQPEDKEKRSALSRTKEVRRNWSLKIDSTEETFSLWKGPSSQGYGFSSGHVWMWELDYKESWAPKNWCFWTMVLEKTLESPSDSKEIQPVHPKWDQSWVFIGRTDAETETPTLWPPPGKSWLIGKDPDAGRDWGQEEGTTENKMVEWHHWLDGHEFEWIPGVGDGHGGLACCDSWSHKELDTTEGLNWTELIHMCVCAHIHKVEFPQKSDNKKWSQFSSV